MIVQVLVGLSVLLLFGLTHILGQIFRWNLIATQGETFGLLYPQNLVLRWFGPKVLKYYNLFIGSFLVSLSVVAAVRFFTR